MARKDFKPGNMLYPVPAVMITVADGEGKSNIFTVAWTGTVCSEPPCVSISVRKNRFSYNMLRETGEFIINLTTKDLAFATDYCGVVSGRDVDKWQRTGLTPVPGTKVSVPYIKESPVAIECRIMDMKELGTHDMFIAEVVAVTVDDAYMDEAGRFNFKDADPLAYSHGEYYTLGECVGKFGYSVRKNK